MQCSRCGFTNEPETKFCEECGTKLAKVCPNCGGEVRPTAKFCRGCGAPLTEQMTAPPSQPVASPPRSYTPPHLAERIRAEQAAMEARGVADGERKTITALFADLKGSTALIEGLDPEEARAIIDPALQLMMEAVHRYDGYVAQVLGDGIFALFGAPIAHEDHPQRALYAALRMQDEMRRYSDRLRLKGGPPLQLRVGINTGEVVVRSIRKEDLHTDYVPVGHSTNLAARMEQMATPGSILVTAYTYKLTEGYFEFKALGAAEIKGVEAPLQVYEVLSAGPLRTRLQVAARRGLTRFVGRQSELEAIKRALEHAQAGRGQIVGVMGEPGLGKSRLFYEFKLTSQSGCLVLEAYSVSHGKASPYLPVIELLKSYFQLQPQDDERTRRERVIGKVLGLDRSLEDTLPYLLTLLGIEDPTFSLQQMDPQIRRRRTFEALKKLFLRESLNQPLILIFEDLHWIDSETQGFLDLLTESVATAKVLLLVNYRPEYRHEWGQKTYYTQLRLAPFGKEEAEEFLTALLAEKGGATQTSSLRHFILEKTEGTPFFMEEVVQELVEQGMLGRDAVEARRNVPLPMDLHIPTTVQGVLAARIDRLEAEEKALLQQLAVIGREFSLSLARQVVAQPEEELYRLLASLQHKEFLYEQSAFPEVEYLFKHALTQEVAYGSVLQERRKALHERTAQALEQLYAANLEDHYSELAHHYSRSGNAEKAVHYLHLAGQQAVQRSAHEEAIRRLTTALEFIKNFPDPPERARRELSVQLTMGIALGALKGFSVPELEHVYTRARELGQQLQDPSQLFTAIFGLWAVSATRAEFTTARELGEQLLRLARNSQDPISLLEAHYVLACTLYFLGELLPARMHAAQGIALYDPQQHGVLAVRDIGLDPGVACLHFAAQSLWHLGYPDQALQHARNALHASRVHAHPLGLVYGLFSLAITHLLRREARACQERAEDCISLATEQGFSFWGSSVTILQGWALTEQGVGEKGIPLIQQGLDTLRASGSEFARTEELGFLAEACGKNDRLEEGLEALAEALDFVGRTGERFYEAELYRLKGSLTLKQFGVRSSEFGVTNPRPLTPDLHAKAEAEACFLKAIEIARRQQAKSLELRAVMSLSRLWQSQGKQNEARQMLAEIYDWFTEGFDTVDLQEAKALLEELSQSSTGSS